MRARDHLAAGPTSARRRSPGWNRSYAGCAHRIAVPCCVMVDGSFTPPLTWRSGVAGEGYESLRGPFNLEARYQAGFTEEEMAALTAGL